MLFTRELAQLKLREGFYSHDPDDRGGETIYGISRRNWPDWTGWALVDQVKRSGGDIDSLKNHMQLNLKVEKFYLKEFWHPSGADRTPKPIAKLLWDAAVNHGVDRSVTWLQQALNVLNDRQRRWVDIAEDGQLGPKTEAVLIRAMMEYEQDLVWTLINIRGAFYFRLARRDESQEKYYRGWMRRSREMYQLTLKEE